ncbi:motility protein A [Mahella sp.]|uniref:motility protein A n=1 Tax=Mahella sp. TaxID=2798721 RepID=UPI0025C43E03|nr:motility protein A [Mahella sp.]MBZ4666232.1 MotA/TolQ/ExbB proton channel [Mahella sp.]
MDIATIAGLIAGIAFIAIGILLNASLLTYYDLPSIMITLGGTIASTLISYPLTNVFNTLGIIKNVFFVKKQNPKDIMDIILNMANTARREGLLALEEAAYQLDDPFMRKGILLVVDGTDPELVKNIMETELNYIEERHKQGWGILESMGNYAPAFGMIGTLIGLINMLKNLNDPDTIGPNMAVAIITTFYGSVLANLIFLPMAQKLKVRSAEEMLLKELVLEGVLSIQAGENPRIIEEKLKAFLPPRLLSVAEQEVEQQREEALNNG